MGRPRIDDRVAFTPIVFVLLTDVPWRMVPAAGVWSACTASSAAASAPPD
jgi:transposase